MKQHLKIQQGDSVRLAITLPTDRMPQLQDLIVRIGRFNYQLSKQNITQIDNSNLFILDLKSNSTAQLKGVQEVLIALDYSDIGVRKINGKQSLSIFIEANQNPLNNESISNLVTATIDVFIENQLVINNVLNVEQGDSVRLAIITPLDRLSLLEDLNVKIGRFNYQLSNQTIQQDSNTFYVDLKSIDTAHLKGIQGVTIALDYSDIGVRKLSENQVFKLVVNANLNNYFNASTTNYVSGTVNVQITENTEAVSSTIIQQLLTSQPYLAEYLKGEQGIQGIQGDPGEQVWSNVNW